MSVNFRIAYYRVCYPLLPQWKHSLELVWTPQVCVKPADSCYPNMNWGCTTKPLVMSHNAWISQSSSAPINVPWGWGQVTVEGKPWQSGLLALLWSSSSRVKALGCVWAHYPAAVRILLRIDSNQTVKHTSRKNWVVPLLRQGGVSSVQVSNSRGGRAVPPPCFTVGLKHCGIILSPVLLLMYTFLLLPFIHHLGPSVNRTFPVTHSKIQVFLSSV